MTLIKINLGTFPNEYHYPDPKHLYHSLVSGPGSPNAITSRGNPYEYRVHIYYPNMDKDQILSAIETGFDILNNTPTGDMGYQYGDTIKQVLAFIALANQLGLISDQDTKTYLTNLDQLNDIYYYADPESNDLDLDIALNSVISLITFDTYLVSFNI